ncbi:unnamed protein product, partial [Bubo scandiacus]
MGLAASATEKAAVRSLMQLAEETEVDLKEGDLATLLLWCRRRTLITNTDQLYDEEVWKSIGTDLWELIQAGKKEARKLAPTYRSVRVILEAMKGRACVAAAAAHAIAAAEWKESDKEEKEKEEKNLLFDGVPASSKVVCPVSEREFWAGPRIEIEPWVPPTMPSAPPLPASPPPDTLSNSIDPVKMPLPMDVDDESSQAVYPKPHSEQLVSLLKEQEKTMSDLLDEMQRLDRGSAKQAIREAYKKAHQAIRD